MPVAHRRFAALLVIILAISAFDSIVIASARINSGLRESSNHYLWAYQSVLADSSGSASASPVGPDVPRMEQVIQSFVSDQHFIGSVLVARGNEIILDKGYGFANLEWDIPNSPSPKFRLGSITKQFTAASILLLE